MEGAIVYRWSKPRAGMERSAWEVGQAVDALAQQWESAGKITGHEWIGAFTGNEQMGIVRGDPAVLMQLSATPEHMELITKGHLYQENFRFDFAVSGGTIDDAWPGFAAAIGAG